MDSRFRGNDSKTNLDNNDAQSKFMSAEATPHKVRLETEVKIRRQPPALRAVLRIYDPIGSEIGPEGTRKQLTSDTEKFYS